MRAASNFHRGEETCRYNTRISAAPRPPRAWAAHLNAGQRLVGPNGVASDHIDPVVVNGDSRLVLTCGERNKVCSPALFNTVKSAATSTDLCGGGGGGVLPFYTNRVKGFNMIVDDNITISLNKH